MYLMCVEYNIYQVTVTIEIPQSTIQISCSLKYVRCALLQSNVMLYSIVYIVSKAGGLSSLVFINCTTAL